MTGIRKYFLALIFTGLGLVAFAQHDPPKQTQPPAEHPSEQAHDPANAETALLSPEGAHPEHEEFNAGDNAVHHIGDANAYHIFGEIWLHLPCFLYAPGQGWTFLSSTARFKPDGHGNGSVAIGGYVLNHGQVNRVPAAGFPSGEIPIAGITHKKETDATGKEKEVFYVRLPDESSYRLDKKSTLDGGLLGGGKTSFSDFSITKNVFTMLLTCILLFFLFRAVVRAGIKRSGQAPRGLQNFLEPFFTFIRDEVAIPNIGPKYERYLPFLLSVFFFILGLNLIGQIPFFPGSANVTGNISVTMVLAIIAFIVVHRRSNRHYWEHIVWMPGVPAVLKVLILTPIEIIGVFLKPLTLTLRLFANIAAGHIVILCFVSLIFVFGKGQLGGSIGGVAVAVPLALFMSALELLVAFLQAFIFTMLTASYIGAAIEEPHH